MATLFAWFTVYHICAADFMVYIKKYIWAEAGESCLLVLSWMPFYGRGRGLRLLGKLGKEGGLGANGWDGGKNLWEMGLSGCVGRREQAPEEVMEGRWLFQGTG